MASVQSVADGIFIGQMIGSNCDASGLLALELSESLIELKRLDGPIVLSKYLYTYRKKRCALGNIMRCVYDEVYSTVRTSRPSSSITAEDFRLNIREIEKIVKLVDEKCQHETAACGPAHRSFPLALCPWISDDDLFDVSLEEAALSHYNPIAGQVSGIVNLICRSLLKKDQSWETAIEKALSTPRLHPDVAEILYRYTRWAMLSRPTHAAYAPAVLNAALFYVQKSKGFEEAIERANQNEKYHVLILVGILAGARWGVPTGMCAMQGDQAYIKAMREMANRLSNLWTSKIKSTVA